MAGKDVAKSGSNYNNIIFLKIIGGRFPLFAKTKSIGISEEELFSYYLSYRKRYYLSYRKHII